MSLTRVVVALAIVMSLDAVMHWYVWARLVRDPGLPDPWARGATIALVLLGLSIPASFVLLRAAARGPLAPLLWIAYTWMGVVFLLVLALGLADLARLALRLASPGALDPERRRTIARFAGGAVALVTGAISAAAVAEGLARVAVKTLRVPLGRLPKSHGRTRIVQLSDVHVGPTIGRGFIEELVRRTNDLSPDVVVITGDLVDGSVEALAVHVAPLAGLRARHGVFFVTGNHEYYSGAAEWIAHLGTLGIRVLQNERVALPDWDLAGVDDASSRSMDVARATAGRDPTRALVLLAHQPRAVDEAVRAGVDLQLSGHTHGGQIFPFNFLVRLTTPYVAGLYAVGETILYVSRGTGYWGPPMRLAAPAEITAIDLVPT